MQIDADPANTEYDEAIYLIETYNRMMKEAYGK